MPWHLVDVYWDLAEDMPFESYSVDVTLSDDVPESVNLYVAPIGLGSLSGTQFYGGLQTQVDGNTKSDHALRKIGRGFLFSMWGERGYDAIRPSEGGYCQSSGHEGDFVSVRRAFAWTKGTYTYRLVRMDESEVDGKPYTWVGALVESHVTGEHVFVGALRFPGHRLVLGKRNLASFVEVYGAAIPDDEIPAVTITFGPQRINGAVVRPEKITAIYPQGVPDFAKAKLDGQKVVVKVGERVAGRDARSETWVIDAAE